MAFLLHILSLVMMRKIGRNWTKCSSCYFLQRLQGRKEGVWRDGTVVRYHLVSGLAGTVPHRTGTVPRRTVLYHIFFRTEQA